MERVNGLEPSTSTLARWRSSQLSYTRIKQNSGDKLSVTETLVNAYFKEDMSGFTSIYKGILRIGLIGSFAFFLGYWAILSLIQPKITPEDLSRIKERPQVCAGQADPQKK